MLVYYNWSNVVKSLKSYSFIVMTVFEAIFIFVWYLIYMEYGWSKLKSKISHLFNSNLTLYNSHIKLWIVILNGLKACRIAYVGKYISPFFIKKQRQKEKKKKQGGVRWLKHPSPPMPKPNPRPWCRVYTFMFNSTFWPQQDEKQTNPSTLLYSPESVE